MWRYVLTVTFLALAAVPDFAVAGAWTQPPGHLYGRLSYAGIDSRSRLDAEGMRIGLEAPGQPVRGTEYRDRELRIYAEYGVREGFTAYGSIAYKRLRLVEPTLITPPRVLPEATHETSGAGDIYFGGRLRVLNGPTPLGVAGEVKIPSGYSTLANPSLGNGHADVTFRGLVGASAGWVYAAADAGWTHRGGNFQDAALFSFELGGRVMRYYSWRGVLRGVRSLGEPAAPSTSPLFDPALSSPRSFALDLVVGDEIMPGLDLEAGISHIQSGRNTLAGNVLEIGLAWSIRLHR